MFANKSFGLLKELAINSEFITNPSMKSNVQKMITLCRNFKIPGGIIKIYEVDNVIKHELSSQTFPKYSAKKKIAKLRNHAFKYH